MEEIFNGSIGTINDITNLKFYTGKGFEIPMQKSYVLTWELIPGSFASNYIQSPISGYFIGDIDFNEEQPGNLKIKENTLQAFCINEGDIYVRFATEKTYDENGMPVFSYREDVTPYDYYSYAYRVFLNDDNKIKVSINIKNQTFTHTFNVNEIFEFNGNDSTYEEYTTVKTIYTGENINQDVEQEFYQTLSISKIDLVKYKQLINRDGSTYILDTSTSYIQTVFEDNVPNIGLYFPFIRYAGDLYQDHVSANFIAADTILVLEEIRNEDDTYSYVKPCINPESEYSLVFQPSSNGELKIIDSASNYNILYTDKASFAMANEQHVVDINHPSEPFSFTIAFQSEEEGAYQNLLGIYLTSKEENSDNETVFFMGAISVKTEVEGEDERFRTLLTNFGIPDPIQYSNIFAEQDYQEEGKDFELINRKSKELMLSYDQIFSYVGTYKALIRAIKFLGYQDIIFKEWYSIKDTNDKITDVAVQVFDSSNGNFLKQKLADYGISIEDYNNYNKLNRISMIYHFNEQSDETEKIKTTRVHYSSSTGKIVIDDTYNYHTFISEVPMTQPIYVYRNEETLAKLFAVKRWLEQHIIGVGAYIADITGEGIYFGWQKTQGYQTQHHLNDFSQEQYYTPDVKAVLPFIESKGKIACTLNELNNAVRFIDYNETPISAFDKYDVSINITTDDGHQLNSSILTITNSIEAPVLGDEYEFDLINKPDSGTLYEWTTTDASSQILIQDGEIKLLFDKDKEAYIDSSCLPIITLENANIHNAYGNWRSNIKWLIREVVDAETGNTQYTLKNYNFYLSNSNQKVAKQYIIIEPDIKTDPETGEITDMPYIKYSEKNKWDIPMFIIHGYKFSNVNFGYINVSTGGGGDTSINEHDFYNLEDSSCDFILEVLKGDFLFKDVSNCACQVSFSNDQIHQNIVTNLNNQYINEQIIQPIYTYHSERVPFVTINTSTFNSSDNIIECADILNNISTNLQNNINAEYHRYESTIVAFNAGVPKKLDTAMQDASNFMINSSYLNDTYEFIDKVQNSERAQLLDSSLNQMINDNYICNKTIDVEITRLGNYEMIVRAFDKYNNIFTSKYDNNVEVIAQPIPIDTYISNENSNNDSDFYRRNIDGSLQTSEQINDIIDACDEKALYPKSYHIYDIDYDLENEYVEFDNISYAIDTPKNNNIVVFDTLNERCIEVTESSNGLRLQMLDENPNKIFLYADTSNIQKKVSVFAYDPLRKEIEYMIEDCNVIGCSLVNQSEDINFESDSWIDISLGSKDSSTCKLAEYVDDYHKIYVLNTTEYPLIYSEDPSVLDSSDCSVNVELDYENKKTYVTFDCEQVFNKEDVIKIRYYYNILNPSINAINDSIGISKYGKIINETAYRITDVSLEIDDSSVSKYVYTIDGLPNTQLLNDPSTQEYIMYAAQRPVKYSTKIIGRAYEYNHVIGFENYSILRDYFNFNTTQLFLKDYIDDTYGIEINDYDYINGEKYWTDFTQYVEDSSNMSMYYYHQFPVSVEQGYNIVFRSHNSNHTFKEGYKKDWRVSVASVDELQNIPENINTKGKETLFRSVNDYLSIKPYMLGSHNIELTCTDIYGNRLVNKGEGLLFVKPNETQDYTDYGYV